MKRRSCCSRGARPRAGVTAFAVGMAGALLLSPAAQADPKSRRVVDGEQARRIALRHGGGAFKPEVATSRSSAGLTLQRGVGNTRSVDLQGRFQHVHYAVPDGKGGFTVGCTDDLSVLQQATGGEAK